MNDPIVDEVRQVRDANAARFDYDLDAIFQDIKTRERKCGYVFVAGVARQLDHEALRPAAHTDMVLPETDLNTSSPTSERQ
jgi:hypothetical protein